MERFRELFDKVLDTLPNDKTCVITPIFVYRPINRKIPVESPVEKSIVTLTKYKKAINKLKEIEHLSLPDPTSRKLRQEILSMIHNYTSYIDPSCYGPADIGYIMLMSIVGCCPSNVTIRRMKFKAIRSPLTAEFFDKNRALLLFSEDDLKLIT